MRSAQVENPDRFLLVDIDEYETDLSAVPPLLASGEPHAVLRDHVLLVPRLVQHDRSTQAIGPWNSDGTVLVTGGTGGWVLWWPGTW